jgi:hypothetical protein
MGSSATRSGMSEKDAAREADQRGRASNARVPPRDATFVATHSGRSDTAYSTGDGRMALAIPVRGGWAGHWLLRQRLEVLVTHRSGDREGGNGYPVFTTDRRKHVARARKWHFLGQDWPGEGPGGESAVAQPAG